MLFLGKVTGLLVLLENYVLRNRKKQQEIALTEMTVS